MDNINKILVFRLSSIGDIILTSALIRCLKNKYPQAKIDFVIKKQFYQLVEYNPNINHIYIVDKTEGFAGLKNIKQQIKGQHYDVFLDIHKNIRSLYVRLLSKAKLNLVFEKKIVQRTLLTSFGINSYKVVVPTFQRYINTAKKLGVRYDGKGTEIHIPETIKTAIKTRLQEQHSLEIHKFIVLCPGASFKNKQWLPERFAELANEIIDKMHYKVLLIGGKAEKVLCEDISVKTKNRAISFAGSLDLLESGALISFSKLVVANDTGMLMMAEAQRIPVVGIYGPTTRQFGFYPILSESKAVEVSLPCRPCTKMGKNNCPKKHWRCMRDITAEMVYKTVVSIISK